MKSRIGNQEIAALTLVEVLVVISVVAILALMTDFGASANAKKKAQRIRCVNNLKQIGLAYRVWPGPQGYQYQTRVSVKNGGVEELVQSGIAYVSYQVMSNELTTPKLLICPLDTNRFAATSFSIGFGNQNVSYFVGVDASESLPDAWLAGDDNFEISGVPVKSGLLELATNTPIAWTAARHRFVGNIGLADGSVQQVTISGLTNLLSHTGLAILSYTGLATNRLAIP